MLTKLPNNGFYITAELNVINPDQIEIAKSELIKLSELTQAEPGCLMFTLHQDPKEPTRFLLWECFADEAAFRAHFEFAYTKDFFALNLTKVAQYFHTQVISS